MSSYVTHILKDISFSIYKTQSLPLQIPTPVHRFVFLKSKTVKRQNFKQGINYNQIIFSLLGFEQTPVRKQNVKATVQERGSLHEK